MFVKLYLSLATPLYCNLVARKSSNLLIKGRFGAGCGNWRVDVEQPWIIHKATITTIEIWFLSMHPSTSNYWMLIFSPTTIGWKLHFILSKKRMVGRGVLAMVFGPGDMDWNMVSFNASVSIVLLQDLFFTHNDWVETSFHFIVWLIGFLPALMHPFPSQTLLL